MLCCVAWCVVLSSGVLVLCFVVLCYVMMCCAVEPPPADERGGALKNYPNLRVTVVAYLKVLPPFSVTVSWKTRSVSSQQSHMSIV